MLYLHRTPIKAIRTLQSIQNSAAGDLTEIKKVGHITPVTPHKSQTTWGLPQLSFKSSWSPMIYTVNVMHWNFYCMSHPISACFHFIFSVMNFIVIKCLFPMCFFIMLFMFYVKHFELTCFWNMNKLSLLCFCDCILKWFASIKSQNACL